MAMSDVDATRRRRGDPECDGSGVIRRLSKEVARNFA